MPTRTRRLLSAPALFVACGIATAAVNGWFQSTVARRFGADDAGANWSLSVVLGGLGLVGLGAQVVVARAGGRPAAGWQVAASAGLLLGAASWWATPGPVWYRSSVAALMAAAGVAVMIGVPPRAALLRERRWAELGVAYLVGSLVRIAVLPLVEWADLRGLIVALAASVAGELAVVGASAILARRCGCRPIGPTSPGGSPTRRELVRPAIALGGLWAITIADGVVARLRLAPEEADAYAIASSVARVGFFMALIVTHLALPSLAMTNERSSTLHSTVNRTYVAIAAVQVPMVLAAMVAPQKIAELVAPNSGITVDVGAVRLLSVAWALIGVIPLATYSHLVRPSRLSLAPLAAAVVVVLIGATSHTARGLAGVLLATVSATALVTVVVGLQRIRPITRAARWVGDTSHHTGTHDSIAVVVPFFNPGPATLLGTIEELEHTLARRFARYRIIAVSDGSTDGSLEAVEALQRPSVQALSLPTNQGKGAALRHGLASAREPVVAYIDADGDLPPAQVADYAVILAETGADAVLASKQHPDSQLSVQAHRTVMSQLFRAAVRVAFRLDVADTQTGLKVFRRDMIGAVLPLLREDGFAFDVELLVAAHARRSVSIIEAPVIIHRQSGSTVSVQRSIDTVYGLVRILWRRHVVAAYSESEPTA